MAKRDQQAGGRKNQDNLSVPDRTNNILINELTHICRKAWEGSICLN